jgi:hypothetical protein
VGSPIPMLELINASGLALTPSDTTCKERVPKKKMMALREK